MRIAVVPGALALLPEYAALTDPVPELRAACLAAVAWLGQEPAVVADAQGERVARALIESADPVGAEGGCLVVLNGSARRTDSSPGPYDDRAVSFDDGLANALLAPDPDALRAVDQELAGQLWAAAAALPRLADLLTGEEAVTVDYDAAPYGVQYWVLRYSR